MSKEDIPEAETTISSLDIAPGLRIIIGIGQKVRNSVLDYALGAGILGLIPVYGNWIPEIRLFLLTTLNLKMILNIRHFWGNHKGQGSLAIIGNLFSIIGSFALAVLAWLMVFGLGLFVPWIDSLARAVAYGVLTWNIGMVTSRYYYSPEALDIKALQKALKAHRSRK